jgi:branched-chain amino acid transport system ATP-binding protein
VTGPAQPEAQGTGAPCALSVTGATVRYGGLCAVDEVSLQVEVNEVFGIIGPNGAGKTTLMNAVSGLVSLTSGSVRVGQSDVSGWRPDRIAGLGVGRTFQAGELFHDFSVIDYMLMGRFVLRSKSIAASVLRLPALRKADDRDRSEAMSLLARYDLDRGCERRLNELPYGLRKLIDVLRAYFGSSNLLLLDEPTSGTAVADRRLIRDVINDLKKDGVTAVAVDHDIGFITDVCGRALAMSYGRPLATGAPHEILSRDDVRAAYVGLEDQSS